MTVLIAFLANILVATAKTIAAVFTGSPSIFAEAAHSWADAGNEVFLFVADRRAVKPADSSHPLGYGRDVYVWSLFAAVGIFTAGAVLSVMHGIQSLSENEPSENFAVLYLILGISAVLEGVSFTQSVLQTRRESKTLDRPAFDYVLNGSNATLRAVFAEDFAALTGLAIAFVGILLHQLTGIAAFDAAGSIAIGVLLGSVALVLIDRNRRFILGEEPQDGVRSEVGRSLLGMTQVERITYLHLEFVGPGQLFVVAAVDLVGNRDERNLARELRALSERVEQNEYVQVAILTPSVDGDPSLMFD
jgi:cation diffusion facilitator family transporter